MTKSCCILHLQKNNQQKEREMKLTKFLSTAFSLLSIITFTTTASVVQHFEFPQDGKLTTAMIEHYRENGFLIFDNYLTGEECSELVAEGAKIISGFKDKADTAAIFSADTKESAELQGQYFKDSVDQAWPFFEKDAFKEGVLVGDIADSINKIAHALGERNPKFRAVTFRSSIRIIAEQLSVMDPRLNQSMLICKPKRIGGIVQPHQDSTFLFTEPNTTTAFWMPLHDATTENGCLYAIPGSHNWPLRSRYRKDPDGPGYIFTDPDGKPFTTPELMDILASWSKEQRVQLPMPKGSLIIFPGNLVHGSEANTSELPRNAYTFHLMSGESEYPADNWLQRKEFARLLEDK
jgi:phytanoyl-CoA hydroxylase